MRTVVILGAGASAGSKWGNPPVVKNFLRKASDLGYFSKIEFEPLWPYFKKELAFSKDRLLAMEEHGHLNIEKLYSHVAELEESTVGMLLEKLIHDVLSACTAEHREKACPYHTGLIKHLQPEAILSFNYDLICDRALASFWPEWETNSELPFDFRYDGTKFVETKNRWSHPWEHHDRENYETNEGLKRMIDSLLLNKAITAPEITEKKGYPLYLKLHGSLNWYYDITYFERTRSVQRWKEVLSLYIVPLNFAFSTERIRQQRGARDYAPSTYYRMKSGTQLYHGTADLKLAIVPPVYQKEFPVFIERKWKKAEKALTEAERIVIVGYSLPEIDLRAERLFRKSYMAQHDRSRLLIDVVDPRSEVVEKFKSLYHESTVRAGGKLAEFVTTIGS